MAEPILSIITVVFNNRNQLEQTLQSVQQQSLHDFEYIVVDGGSTDGSVDCIRSYENGITKWISEKDCGIYDAMNKGVSLATGQWICFLNSGDLFASVTTLEEVVHGLTVADQPDILYGDILIQQSDGSLREVVAKEPCNLHRMYFCHQSAFVKTTLLKKMPFDISHVMSADFKFFKQSYRQGARFYHFRKALVVYDKTGISNSQRNKGLRDNCAIIREVDTGFEKFLFLIRLNFVILWRIIQGKK